MSDKIKSGGNYAPANVRALTTENAKPGDLPPMGRLPGVADDRYEAFNLPSLINGKRVYPKRRA